MASDIVPIRLSLTAGDFVTLWAPRWREDGEEWEAFLGDDNSLFVFPTVAHLAAFVRTATEHDLIDHPAWSVVPELTVEELIPEHTQRYDVIGVPALAAEDADTWTIGELAEITAIVRSIAEVCDLTIVHDVLDSAAGFQLLDGGTLPFSGREGTRLWDDLCATIGARWDEVIDAVDALATVPDVDAGALAAAQDEPAGARSAADAPQKGSERAVAEQSPATGDTDTDSDTAVEPAGTPDFWLDVGIDPIRITTADSEFYTLRCYLEDRPVFLGADGVIEVFGSPRALVGYLGIEGADGHDLTAASTWPDVVHEAATGDLEVAVDEQNNYLLLGIDTDMLEGPVTVDPIQLELAVELLRDAGEWAGDTEPAEALTESESLGWLVSFVIRPDPTRLAPSPPYEAEVARWRELIDDFTKRLNVHS